MRRPSRPGVERGAHHPARASGGTLVGNLAAWGTGADGRRHQVHRLGHGDRTRSSSIADGENPARRRAIRAVSVSVFRRRTTSSPGAHHALVGVAEAGDLTVGEQFGRDAHHGGEIGDRAGGCWVHGPVGPPRPGGGHRTWSAIPSQVNCEAHWRVRLPMATASDSSAHLCERVRRSPRRGRSPPRSATRSRRRGWNPGARDAGRPAPGPRRSSPR